MIIDVFISIIAFIFAVLMIATPIFFVVYIVKLFFGKKSGNVNPFLWWCSRD